jgi:hypothetical protein
VEDPDGCAQAQRVSRSDLEDEKASLTFELLLRVDPRLSTDKEKKDEYRIKYQIQYHEIGHALVCTWRIIRHLIEVNIQAYFAEREEGYKEEEKEPLICSLNEGIEEQ